MITSYLSRTYIPERYQFAYFSVKNFRNYGITVTSRTESSHAQSKAYLKNRFLDLYQLYMRIFEQSEQRQTYRERFEKEIGRRQTQWLHEPIFANIVQKIGWKPMKEIELQSNKVKEHLQLKTQLKLCTGNFTSQWGLPCCHQIIPLMQGTHSLQLEEPGLSLVAQSSNG